MFGVSFTEVIMIALVALLVVGPKKLPEMLGTAGRWINKLRNITTEMRKQTGIDEILREEGLHGGLSELRSLMRPGIGNLASLAAAPVNTAAAPAPVADPYGEASDFDRDREYPVEGPDAYGAIPEDLLPAVEPTTAVAAAPPLPAGDAPLAVPVPASTDPADSEHKGAE